MQYVVEALYSLYTTEEIKDSQMTLEKRTYDRLFAVGDSVKDSIVHCTSLASSKGKSVSSWTETWRYKGGPQDPTLSQSSQIKRKVFETMSKVTKTPVLIEKVNAEYDIVSDRLIF